MWDDDSRAYYGPRFQNAAELAKAREVRIYIHPKLKAKMQYWIDKAKGEVGGLGKIERVDNGSTQMAYVVRSVELLQQEGSPAQVYLDPAHEMAWMNATYPGWREKQEKPPVFFWHSHVDMASKFSYQDDHAIRSLTAMGGVVLSVVGNKREEFDARADFEVPVVGTLIQLPAELRLQPLNWLTEAERAALDDEFDELVVEKTYKEGKYGIDKEIAEMEKMAEGNDKIADVAKAKLVKLREEKKRFSTTTSHVPVHAGKHHRRKGRPGEDVTVLEDKCTQCRHPFDTWDDPEEDGLCYKCRYDNNKAGGMH